MANDDRYTIPSSGGVLKNKLGVTTQAALDRAMNEGASIEWSIMVREPIPDQLDLNYLTGIHRRLLSPVLTWAGEMRQFGDEVIAGGTGSSTLALSSSAADSRKSSDSLLRKTTYAD
jgi:cell filamentation protein